MQPDVWLGVILAALKCQEEIIWPGEDGYGLEDSFYDRKKYVCTSFENECHP